MAIVLYFSISLDGYVAGPKVDRKNPMGTGGEALHEWMFGAPQPVDKEVMDRQKGNVGATVIGRRTFDVGLEHWGDTPYPAPSFVVTHRAHEPMPEKKRDVHLRHRRRRQRPRPGEGQGRRQGRDRHGC